MLILKSRNEVCEGLPKFADVLVCFWKVIREIDFCIGQQTQLVNGDLVAILVLIQESLNLDEIILVEDVDCVFDVVPHLGFDVPTVIAQRERKIRLPGFLRLYLLGNDHEAGDDYFIFVLRTIANKEIFHGLTATHLYTTEIVESTEKSWVGSRDHAQIKLDHP